MTQNLFAARVDIERFASSLYWDHAIRSRNKKKPAERLQSSTFLPTWPELGSEIRRTWRQAAIDLLAEQTKQFPLDTPQ